MYYYVIMCMVNKCSVCNVNTVQYLFIIYVRKNNPPDVLHMGINCYGQLATDDTL